MANSRAAEWSISGVDLHVSLASQAGRGLRGALEDALRDAIRSGRLTKGTRLPPTRALAGDLGVSRGTVQEAYAQLAAEGWIRGRQGSGTIVAVEAPPEPEQRARPAPFTRWRYDLRPGRPDATAFPRTLWLRAYAEALRGTPAETLSYVDPAGQLRLRIALAAYLARARGLRVAPEGLLITSGFTQALGVIARALADHGPVRVAMENPSMPLHRRIIANAGHHVVPIAVDEHGLSIDHLEAAGAVSAVILTPNRQHPTGVALHPARRARLLALARDRHFIVIEDDYDGEFRYNRQPLAPLQALDPDTVIYAGTTSKTLVPGLRLGWLALPPSLHRRVLEQKTLTDWHTGAIEQLALASMIESATYDRHIRTMRFTYRRRRDALLQAFQQRLPQVDVHGAAAGLNVLVPLPSTEVETAALAAARTQGVGIDGLTAGGYYVAGGEAGLVIGYAAAAEHHYPAALEALVAALRSVLA